MKNTERPLRPAPKRVVEAPKRKGFDTNPQPNSKRTKRRKNRGFKSLAQSSRKHRRAASRLIGSRGKVDFNC